MHRVFPRLKNIVFLALGIGIFNISLNLYAEEPDLEKINREGKVYVEPLMISKSLVNGEYQLLPYTERRRSWGFTVGLGYCSYEPINYEANFVNQPYGGLYSSPSLPYIEFQFTAKKNLSSGSLGLAFALGRFQNGNTDPSMGVESELQITPIRLGAVYAMDTLVPNPYVIPYVEGGTYIMLYKESLEGNSFNGNSQVAPYVLGGVAFPLDWIDRHASRQAYEDSGIQSTYIFADVRSYLASSSAKDPDFSSNLDWGAGLKVEF
jgi:hypothetical protein